MNRALRVRCLVREIILMWKSNINLHHIEFGKFLCLHEVESGMLLGISKHMLFDYKICSSDESQINIWNIISIIMLNQTLKCLQPKYSCRMNS